MKSNLTDVFKYKNIILHKTSQNLYKVETFVQPSKANRNSKLHWKAGLKPVDVNHKVIGQQIFIADSPDNYTVTTRLPLTKTDVLLETAQHFNLKNRGVNKNNICSYSDGCGIAYWLNSDTELSYLDSKSLPVDELLIEKILQPKDFKSEVQHITDIDFWQSIQDFHDATNNWANEGMSPHGEQTLQKLLNIHDIS